MIAALLLLSLCGPARAAEGSWRERLTQAERLSGEGRDEEAVKEVQGALADAEKSLGPDDPEIGRVLSRLGRIYETAQDAPQLVETERRLSAIKSKDFDVWFALGIIRRGAGTYDEAVDALKKALDFKPDDSRAEDELAMVYDDRGSFEEEAGLLRKMIEKKPQSFSPYIRLAQTYTRLGRPALAKEIFAQARKLDGKTVDAYVKAGYFSLSAGHSAQAQEFFEEAIAVDTASPFGYHHMGAYLSKSGRNPEAEKYFRLALEKQEADPGIPVDDLLHTVMLLGKVIMEQGRPAEAEAVFRKGLERARPDSERQLELYWWLARLDASQGKSAPAEENYKRVEAACRARLRCRFSFASDVLTGFGEFYLKQGRRGEAEAAAERVEKLAADAPAGHDLFEGLAGLAEFYAELGDDSKREALYARLAALRRTMPFNPDLVWAETGWAGLAAARGRFAEAEDHDRQAIIILEHNRSWREESAVLEDLAALDEKEGKDQEALKAAKDALAAAEKELGPEHSEVIRILSRLSHYSLAAGDVSRFPEMEKRLAAVASKDFDVWFALGTLRRGEGRPGDAEDPLKKALALKPDDPGVKGELAAAYEDMGRFEEAVPLLKEMIERRPGNISPYFQLARIELRLGRSAEAKETYARARKINGLAAADYIKEGYFYLNSGEPAYAEASFESAVAVDTASPFGYHHLGSYWAHRQRYPEAEKYFRQALEKLEADPKASAGDVLHALIWLGTVIQEQGRGDEAEAVYRRGLEKAPPGGDQRLELFWALAKLYASQGKSAQAEENYKRTAAGCEPGIKKPFCFYYADKVLIEMGRLYLKQGRGAEAEAVAERAEKACDDLPIDEGRFGRLREVSILYASLGAGSRNKALYARLQPMRLAMPLNPDLVWVDALRTRP